MRPTATTTVVLALYLASQAAALTAIGPPVSHAKKGDFILGFDYTHAEITLEAESDGTTRELNEIDKDTLLARIGTAPANQFEIYALLGTSELHDYGNEFAYGAGAKATLFHHKPLKIGAAFNFTALTAEFQEPGPAGTLNYEATLYNFQLALGPNLQIGPLNLYAGPFAQFVDGEIDATYLGAKDTLDLEQKEAFGAFAGIAWDIDQKLTLNAEYQQTPDDNALAVAITFLFGSR